MPVSTGVREVIRAGACAGSTRTTATASDEADAVGGEACADPAVLEVVEAEASADVCGGFALYERCSCRTLKGLGRRGSRLSHRHQDGRHPPAPGHWTSWFAGPLCTPRQQAASGCMSTSA
jgi:hypothetical protein